MTELQHELELAIELADLADGFTLPRKARKVRKLIRPARLRPGCELEPRHRVREALTER